MSRTTQEERATPPGNAPKCQLGKALVADLGPRYVQENGCGPGSRVPLVKSYPEGPRAEQDGCKIMKIEKCKHGDNQCLLFVLSKQYGEYLTEQKDHWSCGVVLGFVEAFRHAKLHGHESKIDVDSGLLCNEDDIEPLLGGYESMKTRPITYFPIAVMKEGASTPPRRYEFVLVIRFFDKDRNESRYYYLDFGEESGKIVQDQQVRDHIRNARKDKAHAAIKKRLGEHWENEANIIKGTPDHFRCYPPFFQGANPECPREFAQCDSLPGRKTDDRNDFRQSGPILCLHLVLTLHQLFQASQNKEYMSSELLAFFPETLCLDQTESYQIEHKAKNNSGMYRRELAVVLVNKWMTFLVKSSNSKNGPAGTVDPEVLGELGRAFKSTNIPDGTASPPRRFRHSPSPSQTPVQTGMVITCRRSVQTNLFPVPENGGVADAAGAAVASDAAAAEAVALSTEPTESVPGEATVATAAAAAAAAAVAVSTEPTESVSNPTDKALATEGKDKVPGDTKTAAAVDETTQPTAKTQAPVGRDAKTQAMQAETGQDAAKANMGPQEPRRQRRPKLPTSVPPVSAAPETAVAPSESNSNRNNVDANEDHGLPDTTDKDNDVAPSESNSNRNNVDAIEDHEFPDTNDNDNDGKDPSYGAAASQPRIAKCASRDFCQVGGMEPMPKKCTRCRKKMHVGCGVLFFEKGTATDDEEETSDDEEEATRSSHVCIPCSLILFTGRELDQKLKEAGLDPSQVCRQETAKASEQPARHGKKRSGSRGGGAPGQRKKNKQDGYCREVESNPRVPKPNPLSQASIDKYEDLRYRHPPKHCVAHPFEYWKDRPETVKLNVGTVIYRSYPGRPTKDRLLCIDFVRCAIVIGNTSAPHGRLYLADLLSPGVEYWREESPSRPHQLIRIPPEADIWCQRNLEASGILLVGCPPQEGDTAYVPEGKGSPFPVMRLQEVPSSKYREALTITWQVQPRDYLRPSFAAASLPAAVAVYCGNHCPFCQAESRACWKIGGHEDWIQEATDDKRRYDMFHKSHCCLDSTGQPMLGLVLPNAYFMHLNRYKKGTKYRLVDNVQYLICNAETVCPIPYLAVLQCTMGFPNELNNAIVEVFAMALGLAKHRNHYRKKGVVTGKEDNKSKRSGDAVTQPNVDKSKRAKEVVTKEDDDQFDSDKLDSKTAKHLNALKESMLEWDYNILTDDAPAGCTDKAFFVWVVLKLFFRRGLYMDPLLPFVRAAGPVEDCSLNEKPPGVAAASVGPAEDFALNEKPPGEAGAVAAARVDLNENSLGGASVVAAATSKPGSNDHDPLGYLGFPMADDDVKRILDSRPV